MCGGVWNMGRMAGYIDWNHIMELIECHAKEFRFLFWEQSRTIMRLSQDWFGNWILEKLLWQLWYEPVPKIRQVKAWTAVSGGVERTCRDRHWEASESYDEATGFGNHWHLSKATNYFLLLNSVDTFQWPAVHHPVLHQDPILKGLFLSFL